MVKFAKLVLLCTALVFIAESASAQGFNSVYSRDGFYVIAVGNSGNCFISYNGGVDFGSYPVGAVNLNSVSTGSYFNVVIAGNNGIIYNSTTAGVTWNNTTNGAQNLNGITMFDANTGWAVGNNGAIYKTVNGGTSWTPQTSPNANNLRSVKATSASNAVACGDNGTVIYTVNGGTTWTAYSTGAAMNLLSVDQFGSTIMASGADGKVYMYNGSVWSAINYQILTKSEIRGISMTNANTFFSCGGGGFIRKSNDAGQTFTFQKNPMVAPLSSICFVNGNTGFSVANTNNAVMRTSDGGATWTMQNGVSVGYSWVLKQSSSGNIGNGFCLHPTNKNGIFCMMGNTLYRSLDKGETWSNIATCAIGGSAHTFYVSPLDTNVMMCSKGSSGGYVCRSTNYGATWTSVWGPGTLTSYGMPLEIDQNNPTTWYLAPDNSVTYHSTDNGLTFTAYGTKVFRSPCDIAVQFGNSNIMWVADGITGSGQGDFWKSTDNGVNWTVIHTTSGSEIPMIAQTNLDINVLYHTTWSSGGFWKSTDQGNTFVVTSGSSSNLWGADVSKDDPNSLVYGTYGSTGYLSTDAGNTFITQNLVGSPGAGTLYYDKANAFMQQGSGVYKMVVSYSVTPVTGQNHGSTGIPKEFALEQNYPNPFNPSTEIKYNVPTASLVSVKVFDMLGSEVATVVNSYNTPGSYSVSFDASKLSSGVYFYSLYSNGSRLDTKKMMLVK